MNADDIRKLLKRQPFKPFTIHVAELATYQIPHGDWALVDNKGNTLVIMEPDGGFAWVDVAHVTRITQDSDLAAA
jgi:hypothetical protein